MQQMLPHRTPCWDRPPLPLVPKQPPQRVCSALEKTEEKIPGENSVKGKPPAAKALQLNLPDVAQRGLELSELYQCPGSRYHGHSPSRMLYKVQHRKGSANPQAMDHVATYESSQELESVGSVTPMSPPSTRVNASSYRGASERWVEQIGITHTKKRTC